MSADSRVDRWRGDISFSVPSSILLHDSMHTRSGVFRGDLTSILYCDRNIVQRQIRSG